MRRLAALIQFIVISLIVGYSTYQLFKGNFEIAFASLPLLMGYYVFFVGSRRKVRLREEDEDEMER